MAEFSSMLETWRRPVMPAALERVSGASLSAARTLDTGTDGLPYHALVTRRNVAIVPQRKASWAMRIASLVQGRPQPVTLFQQEATGILGPFAKARKARRGSGTFSDNALLFWPCPGGRPQQGTTRHVLKIAIGRRNLARKIRVLRMAGDGIGATPLIAHDPALRWAVLTYIAPSRKLSASQQADLYLDRFAENWFRRWGVRCRPVSRGIARRAFDPGRIAQDAAALGLALPDRWQEGSLAWSMTHGGGICEEGILDCDDRFWLLDSEKARLAPIAGDLLQAFEFHPQEAIAVFEQLNPPGALPPAVQLAVTLARRAAQNRKRASANPKRLRSDAACADHLQRILGAW